MSGKKEIKRVLSSYETDEQYIELSNFLEKSVSLDSKAIIDCSVIKAINSHTISLFLRKGRDMNIHGGSITLINLNETMRTLFDKLMLNKVIAY